MLEKIEMLEKKLSSIYEQEERTNKLVFLVKATLDSEEKARKDKYFANKEAEEKRIKSKKEKEIKEIDELIEDIEQRKNSLDSKSADIYNAIISEDGFVSEMVKITPDYVSLEELRNKIKDDSFWGLIKKIFSFGGYFSQKKMVYKFALEVESALYYLIEERKRIDSEANNKIEANDKAYLEEIKKIEQYFIDAREEQSKKETKLKEEVKSKLASIMESHLFNEIIEESKKDFISNEMIHKAGVYQPSKTMPKELPIGIVARDLKIPQIYQKNVVDKLGKLSFKNPTNDNLSISLIKKESFERPIKLYIENDSRNKKEVSIGIQNLIYKMINRIPAGRINISFIDPIDRGSNLGLLQKLINLPGGQLFDAVATTKEAIAGELKKIEKEIDLVTNALGDYESIYESNKINGTAFPNRLIVLFDFPKNITQQALDSLEVIINNANKCGISIILIKDVNEVFEKEKNIHEFFETYISSGFSSINCLEGRFYCGGELFKFDTKNKVDDNFISSVEKGFDTRIKINSNFEERILKDPNFAPRKGSDNVKVPFGIDSLNNVKEITIGSSNITHSMVTGMNGSGKSNLLHVIINNLAYLYSPEYVNMWLIDYAAVEFAKYKDSKLPHIKLIGLENSVEFTYGLLDKIREEANKRTLLFKKYNVASINEYNNLPNIKILPRLIIFIDEFHNLSNHIGLDLRKAKSQLSYKEELESLLLEIRKLGISMFFSDQSTEGLKGFTPKAQDQLHNRLLMMTNNAEQINQTIGLNSGKYNDDQKQKIKEIGSKLLVGDLLYAEMKPNDDGTVVETYFDKYKVFKFENEYRNYISRKQEEYYPAIKPEYKIVENSDRPVFNVTTIKEYEKNNWEESEKNCGSLYLGKPASFDDCFKFDLRAKRGNNILILGRNYDMVFSNILFSIKSFLRNPQNKVAFLVSEDDAFYDKYRDRINLIKNNASEKIVVLSTIRDICEFVNENVQKISEKSVANTLCIILGYEDLIDEFSLLPIKNETFKQTIGIQPIDTKPSNMATLSALMSSFNNKINDTREKYNEEPLEYNDIATVQAVETKKESHIAEYNATNDLQQMFLKGFRSNIFSLIYYEIPEEVINNKKHLNLDSFDHKITTEINSQIIYSVLGKSGITEKLDSQSEIYSSYGCFEKFHPYKT